MKHRAIGLFFAILISFGLFRVSTAATVTPSAKPAPQTGPTFSPAPAASSFPKGNVTIGGTPNISPAPTANLALIAYALSFRSKSLTTLITLPAGLPVDQPVEMSIGYFSSGGGPDPSVGNRLTQSYVRSTGNRFQYLEPERDGKPRHMRIDVSLREAKPNGESVLFSFRIETDLDPLYDVQISPLSFTLLNDCATFGDSDMTVMWKRPDQRSNNSWNYRNFTTSAGKQVRINEFTWLGREVSASMHYLLPFPGFYHRGPLPTPSVPERSENLVPGRNRRIKYVVSESGSILPGCSADLEYTITYTLRWYSEL